MFTTGGLLRLSQGCFPGFPAGFPAHNVYDRPMNSAPATRRCVRTPTMFMTGSRSRHQQRCVHAGRPGRDATDFEFSFLFTVKQQSDRVYPRCAILQQGMHMKVFSEVYCDRVYFLCADRFETGSGFDPPAAPPTHLKFEYPPPPPGWTPWAHGLRAHIPPPPI